MKRGFSMVELLVTLAIIAILAAVSLPLYQAYVLHTKRAAALSLLLDVAKVQKAHLAAWDEFLPRQADLVEMGAGCGPNASCRAQIMDDERVSTGLLNLYSLGAFSTFKNSHAMEIEYIELGMSTGTVCPKPGPKPDSTCGYFFSLYCDRDHKVEPAEFKYDVFVVQDGMQPLASTPGPNNGTPFFYIDDLRNEYLN